MHYPCYGIGNKGEPCTKNLAETANEELRIVKGYGIFSKRMIVLHILNSLI